MVDDKTAKVTRIMRIRAVSKKLQTTTRFFNKKLEGSSHKTGSFDTPECDTFTDHLLQVAIYFSMANVLVAHKDASVRSKYREVTCILRNIRHYVSCYYPETYYTEASCF